MMLKIENEKKREEIRRKVQEIWDNSDNNTGEREKRRRGVEK